MRGWKRGPRRLDEMRCSCFEESGKQLQLRARQIIIINGQILYTYNCTCAPMTGNNGMQIFPTYIHKHKILHSLPLFSTILFKAFSSA